MAGELCLFGSGWFWLGGECQDGEEKKCFSFKRRFYEVLGSTSELYGSGSHYVGIGFGTFGPNIYSGRIYQRSGLGVGNFGRNRSFLSICSLIYLLSAVPGLRGRSGRVGCMADFKKSSGFAVFLSC